MLEPQGKKKKERISFIIHLKATLNLELLRTCLSQKHLTNRAVKHLPASPQAEKPSPDWGSWSGNAVSHGNNITSDHAARGLSGGASPRAGTGRNTGTALNQLRLAYPSMPVATEHRLQLLQMLERSNRDDCDFREIIGLRMPRKKNKKI